MKRRYIKICAFNYALAFNILTGCYNGEVDQATNETEKNQAISQNFTYDMAIHESMPIDEALFNPTGYQNGIDQIPFSIYAHDYFPQVQAAKDPWRFNRSVFDDNSDIAPWHANYIGSYGMLPTRFQDKGPFLYSFDISPDADIFHDDDI
jgi:hypothetical protein